MEQHCNVATLTLAMTATNTRLVSGAGRRNWRASHLPDSGPNKVRSGMEDGRCRERRRKFSPEFRYEAVKMVVGGNRPAVQVARELGINPGTLANWVNSYRRVHPVEDEPLVVSERARLRELERENQELRMQTGVPEKSSGLLREPPAVRFAFIQEMDAEKAYRVAFMCGMLLVSRSAYYEWKDRPLSIG